MQTIPTGSILRAGVMAFAFCCAGAAFSQDVQEDPADTAQTEPPAQLSDETMESLFEKLSMADGRLASRIEDEITDRWSKSGSDSADLLLLRGRKALEKRDIKKAIAHFSRLIALRPDFAEGWNARATAYFADRNLGRSLADLYETLRIEPRHFGALIGLGLILERLDRDDDAHAAFSAARDLHPNIDGAKEALERLEESVVGQPI